MKRLKSYSVIATILCSILLSVNQSYAADKPLSLDDLGFKKADTQTNPELQLQLEKRTSMLKTHQLFGLIATGPMVANYLLGGSANHSSSVRNIHMGVGIATSALYFTSASFAIFAPKPEGVVDTGNTKIHRWLSYVHFPLMIITPILGGMAKGQRDNGQKVTGIAGMHGAAATVLLISYLASIGIMTFSF